MTHSRTNIYKTERRFLYAALSLLVLGFCSYIYFVSASVTHVVMRKQVDQEIASLGSNVSQLESQYIEAQHQVSNEIATLHGFTHTTQTIYLDKSASSLALSKR